MRRTVLLSMCIVMNLWAILPLLMDDFDNYTSTGSIVNFLLGGVKRQLASLEKYIPTNRAMALRRIFCLSITCWLVLV
jgi:hypothetical protein